VVDSENGHRRGLPSTGPTGDADTLGRCPAVSPVDSFAVAALTSTTIRAAADPVQGGGRASVLPRGLREAPGPSGDGFALITAPDESGAGCSGRGETWQRTFGVVASPTPPAIHPGFAATATAVLHVSGELALEPDVSDAQQLDAFASGFVCSDPFSSRPHA